MTDYSVIADGLVKTFGSFTAINNISLKVPSGSIYGFLGPNGCGKSTTIRMLTGLMKPTQGEVNVLGLRIPQQAEALRLKIGYMTQKFSLYDDLSVEENLQFISQIFGIIPHLRKSRIEEQLHIYGLNEKRKQRVCGLSGGQKQRLSLAAATLHKPELLFLDEPTSAVDPENRREFWEQLFDLCETGTTILVSTHYMDEAERCHHLAIMDRGIIRADGSPEDLMLNMGVQVLEVRCSNLRMLKNTLLSHPGIRSAAQLGVRLRVLVETEIVNPEFWLRSTFPELSTAEINLTRPSLEDVFVVATKGKQR